MFKIRLFHTPRVRKLRHTAEGKLLLERVQAMASEARLATRPLAKWLGLHQTQVVRILAGDSKLDLVEFVAWCDACGADPSKEFERLLARFRAVQPRRSPARPPKRGRKGK